MISITITGSIVTIATPMMVLVVPISMWKDRNNQKTIIKIAQGE